MKAAEIFKAAVQRYPSLRASLDEINAAYALIKGTLRQGGRLYLMGNGGSACDCAHITGELAKGFLRRRPLAGETAANLARIDPSLCRRLQAGLPAFDLCAQSGILTAAANDLGEDVIFAQQVIAYAQAGDAVWGISTGGNAKNVINGFKAAAAKGAKTLLLTGKDGGQAKQYADVTVHVFETETYKIQELHLPIYHALCMALEADFWREEE